MVDNDEMVSSMNSKLKGNDEPVKFSIAQKKDAKKTSLGILQKNLEKKISYVSFGSGLACNNKLYWYVAASNGKTYYFRSNEDFSGIEFNNNDYSKGLYYIAKEDGF